jgi:hypothetical protein
MSKQVQCLNFIYVRLCDPQPSLMTAEIAASCEAEVGCVVPRRVAIRRVTTPNGHIHTMRPAVYSVISRRYKNTLMIA